MPARRGVVIPAGAGSENHLKASAEPKETRGVDNDFLLKLSHEIRTPMNAIIGMTELALREELPDSAREHMNTAKQAEVSLLAIIDDLLDYSKIESGELMIHSAEYSLSSLLNDVINAVRTRVASTKLRFAVNLDSNLPNCLVGDEARIRQVLMNVLGNAVKYTEKGHVFLRVNGERENENTVWLKIEVEDSGMGIQPGNMEMLFSNFYQGATVSGENAEGLGLGLPIARSILGAMGGEITVESEFGKGSTFIITFPQETGRSGKLAAVENPAEFSILVYERRRVFAVSIVYAIRNLGAKCEYVSEKADFFDKITNGSFSCVFIPYALYNDYMDDLLKFNCSHKVVLLTDFGQPVPYDEMYVLSLPVHAISIANLLNGISGICADIPGTEPAPRFTAPDARVLVVDDIHTNLKVISGLMAPYGMKVDLCLSGAGALKAVVSNDYDMVFMDHRMPEMDGLEATLQIRAMSAEDPRLGSLPIVALTANAGAGMKEMFLAHGFSDFLAKPVDTTRLNCILGNWLPKDKQQTGANAGLSQSAFARYTVPVIEVDGLDTTKGVRMSGDDTDLYCDTLAVFCEDALSRIDKLREYLEKHDIETYITYVHALKSASAYIGADILSAEAYDLEMAGQRRDMVYVITYNEKFITELEEMVEGISAALSSRAAVNTAESAGSAEPYETGLLAEELKLLKKALDEMTVGAIDRAVANLTGLARTEEAKAAVKKLSKHILMGEYDEATALVEELIPEAAAKKCHSEGA